MKEQEGRRSGRGDVHPGVRAGDRQRESAGEVQRIAATPRPGIETQIAAAEDRAKRRAVFRHEHLRTLWDSVWTLCIRHDKWLCGRELGINCDRFCALAAKNCLGIDL